MTAFLQGAPDYIETLVATLIVPRSTSFGYRVPRTTRDDKKKGHVARLRTITEYISKLLGCGPGSVSRKK